MKHLCVVALILGALISLTLSQNFNEPEKCCFDFFDSRIPVNKVTHFEKTDERCPIPGVIFHTVKKLERCVHPSKTWVRDIMNKLQTPANTTVKSS